MKSSNIILLSLLSILMISCEKHRAEKLAGTYACDVEFHSWDINQNIVDSTFQKDIEVKRDGKKLIVLGQSVHIDSLWKEKEYSIQEAHYFFSVRFIKDKIFLEQGGGGLGGASSSKYRGVKID